MQRSISRYGDRWPRDRSARREASVSVEEHLNRLKQAAEAGDIGILQWNQWREHNPDVRPDLTEVDLSKANLTAVDLSRANLTGANLSEANLTEADLSEVILIQANLIRTNLTKADLSRAVAWQANLSQTDLSEANLIQAEFRGAVLIWSNLSRADLRGAHIIEADLSQARLIQADLRDAELGGSKFFNAILSRADLRLANLSSANLNGADLSSADLRGALLQGATLVRTRLSDTTLRGCLVYGVSAWSLDLSKVRDQTDLRITPLTEPLITVDNLEVAQFVYLLLNNQKIRGVIDAIGRKGVLILGRFYEERKAVLDLLRKQLREFDLVPIVFDFDKPTRRDLTETVQLLANMSRFVIADLTDAKSIPQELSHIIPFLPSVPIRPIILDGEYEYSMFEHWEQFDSVLEVYRYEDRDQLIANVEAAIIEPVQAWEQDFDKQKILREKNDLLQARIRELEAQLAKVTGD